MSVLKAGPQNVFLSRVCPGTLDVGKTYPANDAVDRGDPKPHSFLLLNVKKTKTCTTRSKR